MIDLSIVIPLLNEEESIPELYQWIKKVVDEKQYTYEIIFIDDGSTDNSWKEIKKNKSTRPLRTRHSFPKKLWKISGTSCRFCSYAWASSHYDGCRFAR